MKKWIVVVGVFAVLVAAAAAFLVSNLDAYLAENKQWIAATVEKSVGRRVEFEDVGVSLRGGIGVRVDGLRVADDTRFSDEDFVATDSVFVRIKLLPALRGRYEVARVVLESPAITIIRTDDGLNATSLGTGDAGDAEAGSSNLGGAAAAVVIAVIDINDGRLSFIDRTSTPPTTVEIDDVDFSASDVAVNRPVSFDLAAAVLGASEQNVRLSGILGPLDADAPTEAAVEAELEVGPLAAERLMSLPHLGAALPAGSSLGGQLSLDAEVSGTMGDLEIRSLLDATSAAFEYPGTLTKPAGTVARVRLHARRTGEDVEIESAVLELDRAEVAMSGSVRAAQSLEYDLAVTGDEIGLAGWDRMVPALADLELGGSLAVKLDVASPPTADALPRVTGTVTLLDVSVTGESIPSVAGLSTDVTIDGDAIVMQPATVDVAGSSVELSARAGIQPALHASLTLSTDRLLARSLGVAAEGSRNDEELRGVQLDASLSQPADGPREVRGHLRSAYGSVRDVEYSELDARFRMEGTRAVVNPIVVGVFGGKLEGEGTYEMPAQDQSEPDFNFELEAVGVQLAQLAEWGVAGGGHVTTGTLDTKVTLAGTGSTWDAINTTLVGGGKLGLTGGAITNVNIAEQLLHGLTGLPGLSELLSPDLRGRYPRLFSTGETRFDELDSAFSVAQGRFSSDDVTIVSRDFLIFGRGTAGLDRSIDLSATFEASEALTADLIAQVGVAKYLAGRSGRLQLPFKLRGAPGSLAVQPDLSVVRQALERAAVRGLADALLGSDDKQPDEGASDATPSTGSGGSAKKQPAPPPSSPLDDVLQRGLDELFGD